MLTMPCREPIEWGGLRLTTFPAGHCLGSAMLLGRDGRRESLLYTGDFDSSESATAQHGELPHGRHSDHREHVMEIPKYRLPPREDVLDELLGAGAQRAGPRVECR